MKNSESAQNERLEQLFDRYESLIEKGEKPSAEEICAVTPEILAEFKAKVKKYELFESAFGEPAGIRPVLIPEEVNGFCHDRYKVESEFSQGGLGVLYNALDTELGRTVLVKGVRSERSEHSESQRQFVNEASITGRLEHPGIVPIYGFGRDEEQRPYYAMRKISGITLKDAIIQFHANPVAASDRNKAFMRLLQDFRSVCLTIHYAHSRGIIHRDIKPTNIMVGKFGEVVVIDWGLAKQVQMPTAADASQSDDGFIDVRAPSDFHTRLGTVKGSPMYMSPEQASGGTEHVGFASDIYGLGATLYELLTGRAPFEGTSNEILEKVKVGIIPSPSQFRDDIHPALEAICLKAMDRKQDKRYLSAQLLADDIESYVTYVPVNAYAEPWADTVRRWAWRHRTIVSSTAATLIVSVLALGFLSVLLAKYNGELLFAKNESDKAKASELQRSAELEKTLYVNQMMVAEAAWNEADLHRTVDVLDATNPQLRSLEWSYAKQLTQQATPLEWHSARPTGLHAITRLASGPDGAWLMSEERGPVPGSGESVSSTHVIAATNGMPKLGMGVGFLAFNPNSAQVLRRVPVDGQNSLKQYRLALVEINTGRTVWETEPLEDASYNLFAASYLSRNSVADEAIALPEGADPQASQPSPLLVILTDPWAASASGEQHRVARFEFRDATSGRLLKTIEGDSVGNSTKAKFSPDGRRVALRTSAPDTHSVEVLSVSTGKTIYSLKGHQGRINEVAFSDDCNQIATASEDRSVRVWDTVTGKSLAVLWGSRGPLNTVAFSPLSDRVAAAGEDGGIRVWDSTSGEITNVFPAQDDEIYALTFSREGGLLYSGGTNGIVFRFDLRKPPAGDIIRENEYVARVRLSPSGNTIAAAVSGAVSMVRVYDRASRKLKFEFSLLDPQNKSAALYVEDVAFSPDGKTLAIAGEEFVRLLDAQSGTKRWESHAFEGPLDFTPDGKHIVALRNSRNLIDVIRDENLADQVKGEQAKFVIGKIVKQDPALDSIFSYPVGNDRLLEYLERDNGNKTLIATIKDQARGAFVLLDTTTGRTVRVVDVEANYTNRFAMHPTQPMIAIPRNGAIELVDLNSGKQIKSIEVGQSKIWCLAFNPQGEQLVVVGVLERSASIVDVVSGKVIQHLSGSAYPIQSAVYAPDGRRIVTCAVDGTIRIWDAQNATKLWVIEATKLPLYSVTLSKDGNHLAVGGGNPKVAGFGEIITWDVSPTRSQ